MNTKLLALHGLKFNPFNSEIPTEALYPHPKFENFFWRIENTLLREGGFAMISGDPGTGKSVTLRLLASKLNLIRDIQVGVITHSSARLWDFYRELGELFGVPINAQNRWAGFKGLRERWSHHLENTLLRPVLLIDEAQEMPSCVLNELRLLSSIKFDSQSVLSVILVGDQRLHEKLRGSDLTPLASRLRIRLNMEYANIEQLMACLKHLIDKAGNANLMTTELMQALCEHALGNYRTLCIMAGELLSCAVQKELTQLDEKLFIECFSAPEVPRKRKGV